MSPQSKLALFVAGSVTLLLAFAGLGGAQTPALEAFRLAHGWVPAQCSVAFMVAGLSLLFAAFGLPRLTQLGGLLVIATAAIPILEQSGWVDAGITRALIWSTGLSPYGLSISSHSALCFGVLGITLLLIGSRPFPQRGFVLAVLSTFIFALPVSEILGLALNQTAGAEGFFSVMVFTGPAHLLVGWAVLTFAWHDLPPARRRRMPWPPLLLMVGVLVAALFLWEALRSEEDAHLRARVATEAQSIAGEIEAGMERHVEPLMRLSARWATMDSPLGRELAAAFLHNIDGLQKIESVRRDDSVMWSVYDPTPPRAYNAARAGREAVLWSARTRGVPALSEVIPDPDGGNLLIAIPSERRAGTGAPVLLARYRLQPLLNDMLRFPHQGDYAVAVLVDGTRIYRRGDAAEGAWTREVSANLYGREWRVRVTPLPEVIVAARTALPGAVLFAGFLLTLALVWVHYLAQKAVLYAEELGAEVKRREQAEMALQRTNQALEQRVQARAGELHRSAEALTREKELLAVTLDSIGDAVITSDTDGHVVAVNKVAEALTGWSSAAAREQPLGAVFRLVDENNAPLENRVEALLRGEPVNPLPRSAVLITRAGERKYIADSIAPIRDGHGQLLGAVLVFRDVGTLRKLEDELFRAKNLESIGLLAGGIAHDFNNIMTGILGNVSVAKLYTKGDHPAYENLVEAEKGFARARDLTLQLLTFSRGGAPITKTASIGELLHDTATFMLRGSNVRHQLILPANLWPASIDTGQISQALNNLLINAKQAMADGGTLTITAENIHLGVNDRSLAPGNYVKIELQDRGVGIAAEDLPRIFDPYFTTKETGTGLGLSTTYAIIRRHGGHIEAASTPGVGTTFTIYLPAAPESRKAPRAKTSPQEELYGHGRVLLMDDEESVRLVAAKMLRAVGYEVTAAANGQEAIDAFNAQMDAFHPFDAVILDLTVKGGMGGVECLRRLRQRDPGARVVASSGYSNDPVIADPAKYGFDAVVTKPYRLEELSRVVHGVMRGATPAPAGNH